MVKVTYAGEVLHVIPKGELARSRVTVPVSPPSGVTVRGVLAVGAELESVMVGGFAVKLKSATVTVIGDEVAVR